MANKVCIDGIWYELNEETKEATVTRSDNEEEKYQRGVVIPEVVSYRRKKYSVTNIGRVAFYGCSGLTSITISESVTSIGYNSLYKENENAFRDCIGLTSIVVADKNSSYDSRNNCNAIIETKNNKLIAGCAKTIIPESVTSIGSGAFRGCIGLTSINIPESVTKFEYYAFYGCSGLTSITIPESVTEIGSFAFDGCSSLTSITIPESVTQIEDYAFQYSSGLASIIIPERVKTIESNAFTGCSNLKEVYCYNFSKDWLSLFPNYITLHLPKYAIEDNIDLNGFKEIIPIEAKVQKIELPETIILSENVVHTLAPIIKPRYATEQGIKWSSSNEEVAVVNSKGRVIALSSGTATITAMATDGNEVCASCEIVVRRMVESIQLNQTSVKLIAGNTFSLSATVTPKDAYDTSFTWSTTDDDIAMILGNGRIVAVSAGTATITAKANDGSEVTATCEVMVTEK